MDNLYIGHKMVLATPMTHIEYNEKRGWDLPENEKGMENDPGFMVEYIDGGKANTEFSEHYVSWSPAEVFENAYKPIKNGDMPFSQALEVLMKGRPIARSGWNGKGMFVYLVPGGDYPAQTGVAKKYFGANSKVPYGPYIAMKTAQGNVVPWLASQTDILSNDWSIANLT